MNREFVENVLDSLEMLRLTSIQVSEIYEDAESRLSKICEIISDQVEDVLNKVNKAGDNSSKEKYMRSFLRSATSLDSNFMKALPALVRVWNDIQNEDDFPKSHFNYPNVDSSRLLELSLILKQPIASIQQPLYFDVDSLFSDNQAPKEARDFVQKLFVVANTYCLILAIYQHKVLYGNANGKVVYVSKPKNNLENELIDKNRQIAELTKELKKAKQKIKKYKKEKDEAAMNNKLQIQERTIDIIPEANENENKDNKIKEIEAENQKLKNDLNEANDHIKKLQGDIHQLEEKYNEYQQNLSYKDSQIQELASVKESQKQQIAQNQSQLQKYQGLINTLKLENTRLRQIESQRRKSGEFEVEINENAENPSKNKANITPYQSMSIVQPLNTDLTKLQNENKKLKDQLRSATDARNIERERAANWVNQTKNIGYEIKRCIKDYL